MLGFGKFTFCDIEALKLDGLGVVDHGGEQGVDVGGGPSVVVVGRQRSLHLRR